MIRVSAPGKLVLSGEWSILELGNPGIIMSVNKRVFSEISEPSIDSDNSKKKISITIDDFGINNLNAEFNGEHLKWERELTDEEEKYTQFIKGAIETALNHLGDFKAFKIRSWGEMSQVTLEDGETKKIGFGSSAAAVVAIISSILKFNNHDIESMEAKEKIYKLSTITHYLVQGKVGSAFDVAASTYGGIFVYKRFDPEWLINKLENKATIREIVEQPWNEFSVEKLTIPDNFNLLIGWTKDSASTSAMVKKMNEWAETNQEEYERLYNQIANLVKELILKWKENNQEEILKLLRKNEDYLRELGEKSGVNIETPELKLLSEIANRNNAAGKLSGAGGGDCGIAVCFDKDTANRVKNEWKESGFYIIDATVDQDSIKVE